MQAKYSARELAGPGVRTYDRIADSWCLSGQERSMLLGLDEEAYPSLLANPGDLPEEGLRAISLVLGIYQALHTLFPNPDQADGWIRRPNDGHIFGGRPAIDLMLAGQDDLATVRRYLDGQVENG